MAKHQGTLKSLASPVLTKERRVFFLVLVVLTGACFVFVVQHWNELQTQVRVPDDTSGIVRVFVDHYLMLALLRAGAIVGGVLLVAAIAVLLFKVYSSAEFETSLFKVKAMTDEIVRVAADQDQEVEGLKNQIEQLKLELFVKDMMLSSKSRGGTKR